MSPEELAAKWAVVEANQEKIEAMNKELESAEKKRIGVPGVGAVELVMLMASAGEAPPWFVPDMEPAPKVPTETAEAFLNKHGVYGVGSEDGYIFVSDSWKLEFQAICENWNHARSEAFHARDKWRADKEVQRRLQWPQFWARVQLAHLVKLAEDAGLPGIMP